MEVVSREVETQQNRPMSEDDRQAKANGGMTKAEAQAATRIPDWPRHGYGERRWTGGWHYIGYFKDCRSHGLGVYSRPDGTIRHDGRFDMGDTVGASKR